MPPNLPLGTIKGERRVMPKRAHILGSCSLTMWLGNTMNLDGHWCPLSEMKRIIIIWGQFGWWMYERVENHVWHLECSPPLVVLANNSNALTSPHWEIPCNSCWPLLGALATDVSLFGSTQPYSSHRMDVGMEAVSSETSYNVMSFPSQSKHFWLRGKKDVPSHVSASVTRVSTKDWRLEWHSEWHKVKATYSEES